MNTFLCGQPHALPCPATREAERAGQPAESRMRVGRHQSAQRQKRACGFVVMNVVRHMHVQAPKSCYQDAAARMAGFGSLGLLRCTGSGSWDRGLGRSAIGGSWRAACDSCLVGGAWLFRDVEEINAEVKKRRESRLYLSMPG